MVVYVIKRYCVKNYRVDINSFWVLFFDIWKIVWREEWKHFDSVSLIKYFRLLSAIFIPNVGVWKSEFHGRHIAAEHQQDHKNKIFFSFTKFNFVMKVLVPQISVLHFFFMGMFFPLLCLQLKQKIYSKFATQNINPGNEAKRWYSVSLFKID